MAFGARFGVLWTLLGLLSSAAPVSAQNTFQLNANVPMADGVRLSTDVWRNFFDPTPRPVVLRRTPYGRSLNVSDVTNLAQAGFIVVSQDVRGKGDSGGKFLPYFNDKEDGRATIDWIAKQPWSNGSVGTYGASAEGIVQYLAMASAPDALSCAHVVLATPDLYEALFPGGAWRTEFDSVWLTASDSASLIDTWKAHEVRDGYWDAATLSPAEMGKVDHPVFMLGGFFDVFASSQHAAAVALQANVAPSSRRDVFVVMGPWTHSGLGNTRQGQLLYPDEAAMPSYATELLQYLNWCLLGAARPPYANVRYYLTELTDTIKLDPQDNQLRLAVTGEWRDDSTWPPADTDPSTLYLTSDHRLGSAALNLAPVQLTVDPATPTPSVGGGNFSTGAGPFEQTTVDVRPDVYTVTTEPFAQETELVGAPHALIWAASATDDVDVVVRLEVVTPTGKSILFADGVQRGRFVGGSDAIRPLTAGTPVAFDITLGPIALRLPPGHALRIGISAQSSPRYEPNPNSAKPLAGKPSPVRTTLSIYRDSLHPSRIDLPLLSGDVPGAARITSAPVSPMDAGVPVITDASVRSAPVDARVAQSTGLDATVEPPESEPDEPWDASSELPVHREGCSCRAAGAGLDSSRGSWLGFLLGLSVLLARRASRQGRASG